MGLNRTKLLGKYASDKNITIETKYGKEYLACVEAVCNPQTGVKCTGNPDTTWHKQNFNMHEYRFKTTSDGWIVPTDKSNYAEQTKEKTFDELDSVMYCRDCGDIYYPSNTFKHTLDNPHLEAVLLKFIELNPGIIPFGDGYTKFVDFAVSTMNGIEINKHDNVIFDDKLEQMINKIKHHKNEVFASLYPYVKDVYEKESKQSSYYKELKKKCSLALKNTRNK